MDVSWKLENKITATKNKILQSRKEAKQNDSNFLYTREFNAIPKLLCSKSRKKELFIYLHCMAFSKHGDNFFSPELWGFLLFIKTDII